MDIIREIGALVIVFGLLGLLLFAGKRAQWITAKVRRTGGRSGRLELVESLRLGPATTIHIVRIEQELLVLAVNASGCTLLKECGQLRRAGDESVHQNRT